jgi:hypothetical protein
MSPEQAAEATRERARRHYEKNKTKILEQERQERADPIKGEARRKRERERIAALPEERRERQREMTRDWYRRNPRSPEKNAELHYKHRYRMTPEQREEMIAMQESRCYLCGDPLPEDRRKIHVDHDHSCCPDRSCGKCVRGIACDPCNRGVGYFADDPGRMERVARNLRAANDRVRAQRDRDVSEVGV